MLPKILAIISFILGMMGGALLIIEISKDSLAGGFIISAFVITLAAVVIDAGLFEFDRK